MRRILGLLTVVALLQVAAGCRHVAGACDCEHAPLQNRMTSARVNGCGSCGSGVVAAENTTSSLGIYAPAPAPAGK
jgi:hypothetical protein